jgi:hypothetical protein
MFENCKLNDDVRNSLIVSPKPLTVEQHIDRNLFANLSLAGTKKRLVIDEGISKNLFC